MSGTTSNSCECGWRRALSEKLQRELNRREEELKHLKDLLWKSGGSWAQKEQALEEDIIRASEEVLNHSVNEHME